MFRRGDGCGGRGRGEGEGGGRRGVRDVSDSRLPRSVEVRRGEGMAALRGDAYPGVGILLRGEGAGFGGCWRGLRGVVLPRLRPGLDWRGEAGGFGGGFCVFVGGVCFGGVGFGGRLGAGPGASAGTFFFFGASFFFFSGSSGVVTMSGEPKSDVRPL